MFNNEALAQSRDTLGAVDGVEEIRPIQVGHRVPADFWTTPFTLYNHEASITHTMEQYKGKNILLGFWSIYCGACLSSFPFLNEAQAVYQDDLIVLPVNSYDKDLAVIEQVLRRFDDSYRISGVVFDSYFKALFPHYAVPQYIWISKSGDIEAITGKGFLSMENISKFVKSHGKH